VKRKYSEKTIKILFGRATRCAYPDCREMLIFEDRGHLTVNVQIGHIRSGSPDGPRPFSDYNYPLELIDSEENLLLLCGKHHKPVDDHESIYQVDELLDWKRCQVAASTGRELSEYQLTQIVQHLEQSLTEVKLTVRPVGVIHTGFTQISIPLAGLVTTTVSTPEQDRYLGVEVINEGLVPITIDAVGIDLDVEAPSDQGYPGYQFLVDDPLCCPPRRIEGKSSATWLAHPPTVGAVVMQIVRDCLRMPSHFRPYVLSSAGNRVEGQWVSATQLPIWELRMTEKRLQDILEKSAEARRRAQASLLHGH
jgi:hypothetical protein